MANQYLYLRPVFEREKTGDLERINGFREYPLAPNQYKLGCDESLSPALLVNYGDIATLLGIIGLTYSSDINPSPSSKTAWRLASNPNQTRRDMLPYSEGSIVDTNDDPFRRVDIAEHITLAFRTRQDFFGTFYDSAGNGVFLQDFIGADCHRII